MRIHITSTLTYRTTFRTAFTLSWVVHLKEFRPTNELFSVWGMRRRDQVKEIIMSRKESCDPELVMRRTWWLKSNAWTCTWSMSHSKRYPEFPFWKSTCKRFAHRCTYWWYQEPSTPGKRWKASPWEYRVQGTHKKCQWWQTGSPRIEVLDLQ